MSLLLLVDVKPHLKIDQATDNTVLQDKLDAAEAFVSREIGGAGALASTTVTETVRACGAIALNCTPLLTVTSVTAEIYGAFPTTNLRINLETGVLRAKAYTLPLREDYYTVVYTTGFASAAAVPPRLVEAVRLMTQHFYATQRGGNRRSTGGDQGAADAYARAMQILESHPGVA